MNVRGLFKRKSILFESASFGNIIFLTTEDRNFIRNIGIYVFDNFDKKHEVNLKEAAEVSALYKMLKKESVLQLQDQKKMYWNQDHFNENDIRDGFCVGSVSEKNLKESGFLLSKKLREENIFLYLPVLEDWFNYYIPKSSNETVESREIMKCSHISVKGQSGKRNVVTFNDQHDLIEVVRESNG